MNEILKRLEGLEKRVAELEAQPRLVRCEDNEAKPDCSKPGWIKFQDETIIYGPNNSCFKLLTGKVD